MRTERVRGLWRRFGAGLFVLFALYMSGITSAQAQVEMTLSPAQATATAGGTVAFRATIRNTGANPVYINQISVSFDSSEAFNTDPTDFFVHFAKQLGPGEAVTDQVLFRAQSEPTITPGRYAGAVAILGGSDMNGFNRLAQRDFSVEVTANSGPPETTILSGPGNGEEIGIPEATFTYVGTDEETPTQNLRYRWRFDNGAWQGPTTETRAVLKNLPYGAHTFSVVAIDEANQEDPTPATRTFTHKKPKILIAAPDEFRLTLRPTVEQTKQVEVSNIGTVPITGLTAEVADRPANLRVDVTGLPNTLAAGANATVTLRLIADNESTLAAQPVVRFASADGEGAEVRLPVNIIPRRPRLEVTPVRFEAAMLRGRVSTVEVEITNTGGVAAEKLTFTTPSVFPWLTLSSPAIVERLEPDAKTKVTLTLTPAANQALGPYTGSVQVLSENATGITIPFAFNCITDGRGSVRITAEDEYSYFAQDRPKLGGATIQITHPATGAVVAEGITPLNSDVNSGTEQGVIVFPDLPEGVYNIQAVAEGHADFNGVVEVTGGQQNESSVFLSLQLVSYFWSVIPVDTEDRYLITLEALFQTNVPAPVLTLSPGFLDMRKLDYDENDEAVVYYTITNHGLIAINDVKFGFEQKDGWTVTPAKTDFGTLPALQTVVVPVRFKKPAGYLASNASGKSTFLASLNKSSDSCATSQNTAGGLRLPWRGDGYV